MAIEPTSIQRDRMLKRGKTKQILVQFIVFKSPGMEEDYLRQSRQAVINQGGSRDYQREIKQALTTGQFPYQFLIVDRFPSSDALLQTHEITRDSRNFCIEEIYALIVKPDPSKPLISKTLVRLTNQFSLLLKTTEIKEFSGSFHRLDPDTDPTEEKVMQFESIDRDQSCAIINLNRFSPGGKSRYGQYSIRVTPYLASVGGYPLLYGDVLGTYIGDQSSKLHNSWHGFALVYYPTRQHFLRMMTNTPAIAAQIRREGLEKAILLVC